MGGCDMNMCICIFTSRPYERMRVCVGMYACISCMCMCVRFFLGVCRGLCVCVFVCVCICVYV